MLQPIQPAFSFDTSDLSEHNAFDVWCDRVAGTWGVTLDRDASPGFYVRYVVWHRGQAMITSGDFSAQGLTRDPWRIRHDQVDHYGLFVQGRGWRVSHAGDRESWLAPGGVQIFDMAQQEELIASEGTSGTLYLPRDLVDEQVPLASGLHGLVLRDGAARLLAQHVLFLGQNLMHVPQTALPGVTQATLDMALGCLAAAAHGQHADNVSLEPALRREVERYVDAHLGDPQLTAETLCATFQLSRSTLYRLFEVHGGVANFVKTRRLTRIRSILLAMEDSRTLAALAESFGFSSGGHLSREFHKQFGCSPSELRTGLTAPAPTEAGMDAPLETVFRMLHP